MVLLPLGVSGAVATPVLLGWSAPGARVVPLVPAPMPATTSARPAPSPTLARTSAATPHSRLTAKPPQRASGLVLFEDQVLEITNAERVKHGCPTLRMDASLRIAARRHSDEMARYRTLTHTGRNGSDPGDRMEAAGYDASGGWAENVASGYATPVSVMRGWMDSDGHRQNILTCAYRAVGVGVARASNGVLYWTQDFGGL